MGPMNKSVYVWEYINEFTSNCAIFDSSSIISTDEEGILFCQFVFKNQSIMILFSVRFARLENTYYQLYLGHKLDSVFCYLVDKLQVHYID
jgi:hypothetical protein